MILRLLLLAAMLAAAVPSSAQELRITGPNRQALVEGETYAIGWSSTSIESVSIVAHGTRTPLGGRDRGRFSIVLADGAPAQRGEVAWLVPWIDSVTLFVKIKGYDSQGREAATDERGYGFRPAVLADRTIDGLYIDLHKSSDQRIYEQSGYRIRKAYISTSSENYLWRPANRHISRPHDHAGVFSILEKKRMHWSTLFDVEMPWAMRYHGGHFIHATSPNLYRDLGRAASHGCNRLTREDARQLFQDTPLGTRVEVIGPADQQPSS